MAPSLAVPSVGDVRRAAKLKMLFISPRAGDLAFARLVRLNLMHRKPLDRLLDPEPPIYSNPAQMALQWNCS